jgi:hypothetical protein
MPIILRLTPFFCTIYVGSSRSSWGADDDWTEAVQ